MYRKMSFHGCIYIIRTELMLPQISKMTLKKNLTEFKAEKEALELMENGIYLFTIMT